MKIIIVSTNCILNIVLYVVQQYRYLMFSKLMKPQPAQFNHKHGTSNHLLSSSLSE
jgi:hypothetical protein